MVVQPLVHRLLLVGRHEMVGAGDVQRQRPRDRMLLAEQSGDADRIIADAGIDVGARRGHEGEPAAEADSRPTPTLPPSGETRARGADRRLDVLDALVLVEPAHQVERLLELVLHVGIELDARLAAARTDRAPARDSLAAPNGRICGGCPR